MQKSKFKILSFFRQRRISLWLNFLAVAFSFSLLAFHFASPAFAQGTCTWTIERATCMVDQDNCDHPDYVPLIRKTASGCTCDCIKSSFAIPRYQDIPEFKGSKLLEWLTIGDVFSDALKYVYIFAGLGVFVYLIFGGFQLMTSGGDPAGISAGTGKITNAIIGFIIIFASYWLIQIIEVIFGMTIL